MMKSWLTEFARLLALCAPAMILGAVTTHLGWSLLGAVLIFLAYHLGNLYRLQRWLQTDKARKHPPDVGGVWGDLVATLYRESKHRRRLKHRLGHLLDEFDEFTRAMPDAMIVIDEQNVIRWLNEAAASMFELDPHADLGQRIGHLLRQPEFQHFLHQGRYDSTLELSSPQQADIRLSVRIVPFGQQRRLIAARDVSDFFRLEQMRRDFIANVSPELRTPLTVLSGYLESWEEMRVQLPELLRPSLEHMRGQTARMQQIIDDLLTLSRLDSQLARADDYEEVPIPAMVSALKEDAIILGGSAAHVIDTEIDDTLWLRGVTKELHSAMANLVSNAVRYTPAGGRICLRWVRAENGAARFEVSDSGIGIAAADIPRLTERFYRVDKGRSRASGGTGLGLAIVKHVLERHGARLEILSKPGLGSTFSCLFPASRVLQKPIESPTAGSLGN